MVLADRFDASDVAFMAARVLGDEDVAFNELYIGLVAAEDGTFSHFPDNILSLLGAGDLKVILHPLLELTASLSVLHVQREAGRLDLAEDFVLAQRGSGAWDRAVRVVQIDDADEHGRIPYPDPLLLLQL